MILLIDFGSRCDPNVSANPRARLRGNRENSQFWPIPTSFVCYYSLIFVPAAIRTFREPRGPVTGNSSKLAVLVYFGQFCMLLLTDFRSRCDPNVLGTPGSGYGELVKTSSFGLFWLVLYAITHSFWAPLRSKRFGNTGLWIRGTRQNTQFWPILASFVCY